MEELRRGVASGYEFLSTIEEHISPPHGESWLILTRLAGDEELALRQELPRKLHEGEATSLAIASCRGWRLLTDDRDARTYAARIGVPIGGTVGILAECISRRLLTLAEANQLLSEMVTRAGYRSPVSDLRVLLPDLQ